MAEHADEELVRDGAMSVAEGSRFLGVGRSHLYDLMARGEVRYLKIGARRVIPRAELVRYLAAQLGRTDGR